jgi:diamine N-acetyltransferase
VKPEVIFLPWASRRAEVLAIEIREEQKRFLGDPTVAEFLADEDDHPTFRSYVVCSGETVVGLACYGQEVEHESWRWWIPLVVIDRRHQGKGYGRAVMEAVVARIQSEASDCRAVGLSCKPENVVAWSLYRSLGFEPGASNARGGADMWLMLDDSAASQ